MKQLGAGGRASGDGRTRRCRSPGAPRDPSREVARRPETSSEHLLRESSRPGRRRSWGSRPEGRRFGRRPRRWPTPADQAVRRRSRPPARAARAAGCPAAVFCSSQVTAGMGQTAVGAAADGLGRALGRWRRRVVADRDSHRQREPENQRPLRWPGPAFRFARRRGRGPPRTGRVPSSTTVTAWGWVTSAAATSRPTSGSVTSGSSTCGAVAVRRPLARRRPARPQRPQRPRRPPAPSQLPRRPVPRPPARPQRPQRPRRPRRRAGSAMSGSSTSGAVAVSATSASSTSGSATSGSLATGRSTSACWSRVLHHVRRVDGGDVGALGDDDPRR